MSNTIEYKGYIGSVEFSEDDCLFYTIDETNNTV